MSGLLTGTQSALREHCCSAPPQIPASWATHKGLAWGCSRGISITVRPWPARPSIMAAAWGMATTSSRKRSVYRPAGPWVSATPSPLPCPLLSSQQTACPLDRWPREDAPAVEFQGQFPEGIGIEHLGVGDPQHVCLLGLGVPGDRGPAGGLRSAIMRFSKALCSPPPRRGL